MSKHVHVHLHTRDSARFDESKHPRKSNGEFGQGSADIVKRQNAQMAQAKHHAPREKPDGHKDKPTERKEPKASPKAERLERKRAEALRRAKEAKAKGDRVLALKHQREAAQLAIEISRLVRKSEKEIERTADPKKQ